MKKILTFFATILVLAAFLLAGEIDRTNEIIYTMPEATYYEIRDSLHTIHNEEPSESQIADFYIKNY